MEITLYIDDREKHVTRHMNLLGGIKYKITRLTIGDYAICLGENIIASIERKSLEDLAASVKDGRYDNKSKLIDLRTKTGCAVYFLIEGWIPHKASSLIGNTPWEYLESACDHMTIRDKFLFLFTRDTGDTASRLARFVSSMNTLNAKGELHFEVRPDLPPAIELLSIKHEIKDEDVVRALWSCFPGVAVVTADAFRKRYCLADVIRGRVLVQDMTLEDGKHVNARITKHMSSIDRKLRIRMLACIPGISAVTAGELLTGRTLAQLLSYDVGAISIVKVGKPERNLGEKRAGNIKHYFEFDNKALVPPALPLTNNAPLPVRDETVQAMEVLHTPPTAHMQHQINVMPSTVPMEQLKSKAVARKPAKPKAPTKDAAPPTILTGAKRAAKTKQPDTPNVTPDVAAPVAKKKATAISKKQTHDATLPHNTKPRAEVQCNQVQCNQVQCDQVQCDQVQCDQVQCDRLLRDRLLRDRLLRDRSPSNFARAKIDDETAIAIMASLNLNSN